MERSPKVVAGLAAFYEAFNTHDVDRFAAHIADGDGVSVIGSAPGEGHDSRDDWVNIYGAGIAAMGLRLEGGDSPTGFRGGDVGYARDTPAFVLPDGSRLPTRLTAVLAEQDGEWRMVHAHFSVGVPDEQAIKRPD
jgi:ketosteroid isomerase-like protein